MAQSGIKVDRSLYPSHWPCVNLLFSNVSIREAAKYKGIMDLYCKSVEMEIKAQISFIGIQWGQKTGISQILSLDNIAFSTGQVSVHSNMDGRSINRTLLVCFCREVEEGPGKRPFWENACNGGFLGHPLKDHRTLQLVVSVSKPTRNPWQGIQDRFRPSLIRESDVKTNKWDALFRELSS